MPRRVRECSGGIVYHVLNRAVGRIKLFEKERDFPAFENIVEEAWDRTETRILSYCVMATAAVRGSVRRGRPLGSEVRRGRSQSNSDWSRRSNLPDALGSTLRRLKSKGTGQVVLKNDSRPLFRSGSCHSSWSAWICCQTLCAGGMTAGSVKSRRRCGIR